MRRPRRRLADLREPLARLLQEAGLEVAGQAADREQLLEQVERHEPAVAILDIRMSPSTSAYRAKQR